MSIATITPPVSDDGTWYIVKDQGCVVNVLIRTVTANDGKKHMLLSGTANLTAGVQVQLPFPEGTSMADFEGATMSFPAVLRYAHQPPREETTVVTIQRWDDMGFNIFGEPGFDTDIPHEDFSVYATFTDVLL